MTDHPQIFQGPMVRGMLEDRKTETRRIVSLRNCEFGTFGGGRIAQEFFDHHADFDKAWPDRGFPHSPGVYLNGYLHVPAHKPKRRCKVCRDRGWEETVHRLRPRVSSGDRLWVKENFAFARCSTDYETGGDDCWWKWDKDTYGPYDPHYLQGDPRTGIAASLHYEADGEDGNPSEFYMSHGNEIGWSPSIHMPRWASRLTLPVLATRIERLQEITDEAAKAEGVVFIHHPGTTLGWHWNPAEAAKGPDHCLLTARHAYGNLWQHINGAGAWNKNPWVTVTQYRVIKANIDAPEAAAA